MTAHDLAQERERTVEILARGNVDEWTASWIASIESGRYIEHLDSLPRPQVTAGRPPAGPRTATEALLDRYEDLIPERRLSRRVYA